MGRFPLYADADIHGPLIAALVRNGWDVARAVDLYPEGTADEIHFERAAREQRILVSNDKDQELHALEWLEAGRAFQGLVTWAKRHEQRMTAGDFLMEFEALTALEQPFPPDYPIVYLKPGSIVTRYCSTLPLCARGRRIWPGPGPQMPHGLGLPARGGRAGERGPGHPGSGAGHQVRRSPQLRGPSPAPGPGGPPPPVAGGSKRLDDDPKRWISPNVEPR